jgi:hypothetical protein
MPTDAVVMDNQNQLAVLDDGPTLGESVIQVKYCDIINCLS